MNNLRSLQMLRKSILWNKEHIEQIEKVLDALKGLQDQKDGSFFKDSNKSEKSVFITTECLFPYLLYPFSQKYSQVIDNGIKYIIANTTIAGVPADNQFPSSIGLAIDPTAFGIYVFIMARNYYLEERKPAFLHSIEERLKGWIKFIADNKNDLGWGILSSQESRVQSTNLVIGALSNCEDSFFKSPAQKSELLDHGIQYLKKKQVHGGWGCKSASSNEKEIINMHITATAIFALNSSLRFNFKKEVEAVINSGAKYLLDNLKEAGSSSFIEVISVKKNSSIITSVFEHPYFMVLPALLMTGHMGFHADNILILYKAISDSFNKFTPYKVGGFNYWELSDTANALILFFSTANVARNSDMIFSSAGFCPACQRVERFFLVKKFINCSRSLGSFLSKHRRFCFFTILWIIALLVGLIYVLPLYIDNFYKDILTFPSLLQIAGGIALLFFPIKMLWKESQKKVKS